MTKQTFIETSRELFKAATSLQNLLKFVRGDFLVNSIAEITGDIHTEAAKVALSTPSRCTDDRIRSAITHLEASHVAYKMIHGKSNSFRSQLLDFYHLNTITDKDAYVCCLCALCYAYFDDKRASIQYLNFAHDAHSSQSQATRLISKYWQGHDSLIELIQFHVNAAKYLAELKGDNKNALKSFFYEMSMHYRGYAEDSDKYILEFIHDSLEKLQNCFHLTYNRNYDEAKDKVGGLPRRFINSYASFFGNVYFSLVHPGDFFNGAIGKAPGHLMGPYEFQYFRENLSRLLA